MPAAVPVTRELVLVDLNEDATPLDLHWEDLEVDAYGRAFSLARLVVEASVMLGALDNVTDPSAR
jgi:hypothetical protein